MPGTNASSGNTILEVTINKTPTHEYNLFLNLFKWVYILFIIRFQVAPGR